MERDGGDHEVGPGQPEIGGDEVADELRILEACRHERDVDDGSDLAPDAVASAGEDISNLMQDDIFG